MAPQTRRASKRKPSVHVSFITLRWGKPGRSAPPRIVKRRRSSAKGAQDSDRPHKKTRTWSSLSNPAIGTRSQTRALEAALSGGDDIQSAQINTVVATRTVTTVEETTAEVTTTQGPSESAEISSQDISSTLTETTDLAARTEIQATATEVKVEENAQSGDLGTPATFSYVDTKSSIADADMSAATTQATGLAVMSTRAKSTSTVKARVPQKKGSKKSASRSVKSVQKKVQQTSLLAHVRAVPPPPPSQGKKFLIAKLRYSGAGGTGTMPVALLKVLPILERYLDKDGNLKLPEKSKFWDTLLKRIKFGFSPFITRLAPQANDCHDVLAAMESWGLSLNPPIRPTSQGAAYNVKGFNIGCFLKTILAQGTDNKLAIRAEAMCRHIFPFIVDGKKLIGKTPNYHAMAAATVEEVALGIKHGGTNMRKALSFKRVMDTVTAINITILKEANDGILPFDTELGQPANTPTFVPGLLSCDFLFEKDKAQLFNWFLSLSGIGHKTASCFLEFNFGFPICAVDTHVITMAKFLRWAEKDWDEVTTFRHLEGRIPDELKHAIHQTFWHHRQRCERCKLGLARDDPGRPGTPACPIEDRMVRFKNKDKGKTEADDDDDTPKRPLAAKKVKSPDWIGKKPSEPTNSTVIAYGHFANAEKAAKEGYVLLEYSMDDDFAAGSVNVSTQREWWFRGFEEEL